MTIISTLKEDIPLIEEYSDNKIIRYCNEAGMYAGETWGLTTTSDYEDVSYSQYQVILYYIQYQVCMHDTTAKASTGGVKVRDGYSAVEELRVDPKTYCQDYKTNLEEAIYNYNGLQKNKLLYNQEQTEYSI